MAVHHSAMTLRATNTTNTAGRAVHLGWVARHKVSFAVTFPGGGTTKCTVRAQVKGPGPGTVWTSIGSANSTISSTAAGKPFTSTSATPFVQARLLLVTRTTAGSGTDGVSGWIVGA